MIDIFGKAFSLFGWFFWIVLLIVFVWSVLKLLERFKNNDVNTYYNISSEDVVKNIKGKEERYSRDEINNNIQG